MLYFTLRSCVSYSISFVANGVCMYLLNSAKVSRSVGLVVQLTSAAVLSLTLSAVTLRRPSRGRVLCGFGISTTLWPTAAFCNQSSYAVCSAFLQLGRRLERLRSADRRLSKCSSVSAVHRAVWWQLGSVTQPTLLSHSMYTRRRRRLAAAQLTTLTAIARCRIQLPLTPSARVVWTK